MGSAHDPFTCLHEGEHIVDVVELPAQDRDDAWRQGASLEEDGASVVVLVPGHALTGRVLGADGVPRAGMTVFAQTADFFGPPSLERREAVSDAAGAYRLEGLNPGTWKLIVRLRDNLLRGAGTVSMSRSTMTSGVTRSDSA